MREGGSELYPKENYVLIFFLSDFDSEIILHQKEMKSLQQFC
jgi:hypothetical protein